MRRMLDHLTYANLMSTLLAFVVLGGGTAYAANEWTGDNIVNGSLKSPDLANGGVTSVDIADGDLRGADIADESLRGTDIADNSGVDTCVAESQRFGSLCARVLNLGLVWEIAPAGCASVGMRLPALGEAVQLAASVNIPGITEAAPFWTSDAIPSSSGGLDAFVVRDNTSWTIGDTEDQYATVCVATPTN